MKIGLDQPNGFIKHFSNEDYKYVDQSKPSTNINNHKDIEIDKKKKQYHRHRKEQKCVRY